MGSTDDLFKNMSDQERRLWAYATRLFPDTYIPLAEKIADAGHMTSQKKQDDYIESYNRGRFYDEIVSMLEAQYEEVDGYSFYKEIFPDNENSGEKHRDFSHPNAIYLFRNMNYEDSDKQPRMHRRVMLNDTWENDYMEYVEKSPCCLCGGLAYRTNVNQLNNAQKMYAMIFDLDGVGKNELLTLFKRFELPSDHASGRTLPRPTFINCSGNGLHLVYQFDVPIDLYPNIKTQLKSLKHDLTFRIWHYGSTTTVKNIQYQSINQGYRMVGSLNEKHNVTVKSFRTGEKISLAYLNEYVPENSRVDINRPFQPSKMTRAEAAIAYPDWYERVVEHGNKNLVKWDIAGKVHGDDPYALYHWWKKKASMAKGGHRYFFLMCMAIYACKCDYPYEELEKDMWEIYEILKLVEHDNPMKPFDVESALEAYDKEYYNYTIDDIIRLSDIPFEKNIRHYQNQADHLEEARAIRDIRQKRKGTKWTDNNGRPKGSISKKNKARDKVITWHKANPEGTKAECNRETGVSPKTIRKWWDYE